MTKDDYKAKIREAIMLGYEVGSSKAIINGWELIGEFYDDINNTNNEVDKLVDNFLDCHND